MRLVTTLYGTAKRERTNLLDIDFANGNDDLFLNHEEWITKLKMAPIRVLLVDDNPEFLDATERFLSADSWLEVIGQSLSGEEALEQTSLLKPDLVLMDLALPKMNGLEATRHIKSLPGAPRVIILTFYDNSEYRTASEAVQADGFVPKAELGVQLIKLIHTLFEGENIPDGSKPN